MAQLPPIYNDVSQINRVWWQGRLGGPEAIGSAVVDGEDLDQSITIILSTPKGTDPFRPQFACNLGQYLDRPIHTAGPFIIREAMEAVLTWEPRIAVTFAEVRFATPDYSTSLLDIHWALVENPQIARITTVPILRSGTN